MDSGHFRNLRAHGSEDTFIAWNRVIFDVELDLIGLVRNVDPLDHESVRAHGYFLSFSQRDVSYRDLPVVEPSFRQPQ